jgi:hypothetical protein
MNELRKICFMRFSHKDGMEEELHAFKTSVLYEINRESHVPLWLCSGRAVWVAERDQDLMC